MKKWKYLSMTAILGSAMFLAACGDDEENKEAAADTNGSEQADNEKAALLKGK